MVTSPPLNTVFLAALLAAVVALSLFLPCPDPCSGGSGSLGVPLCVFKLVTGVPCPFCGLTRSFICTAHLRIEDAFCFHPLGPFLWAAACAGIAACGARLAGRAIGKPAGSNPRQDGKAAERGAARFAWISAFCIVMGIWAVKLFLISRCYW